VSDPVNAQRKDLFGYGTVATISGMRGRRQGELALVVEGIQRFKVERFTQFTPYIECEGTFLEEDGKQFLAFCKA
jgi:ATP-dependent Lon protease